jgi:hypothetical protein
MKRGLRRDVCYTAKKFSDNPDLIVRVFVEIDMVGGRELVHPEFGDAGLCIGSEEREDIVAEVSVKRVTGGKLSDIFHALLIAGNLKKS